MHNHKAQCISQESWTGTAFSPPHRQYLSGVWFWPPMRMLVLGMLPVLQVLRMMLVGLLFLQRVAAAWPICWMPQAVVACAGLGADVVHQCKLSKPPGAY